MKYFKIEHNHVGVFAKGQIVSEDDIDKAKFKPFLENWVKIKAVSETEDPNSPAKTELPEPVLDKAAESTHPA